MISKMQEDISSFIGCFIKFQCKWGGSQPQKPMRLPMSQGMPWDIMGKLFPMGKCFPSIFGRWDLLHHGICCPMEMAVLGIIP